MMKQGSNIDAYVRFRSGCSQLQSRNRARLASPGNRERAIFDFGKPSGVLLEPAQDLPFGDDIEPA